MIVSTFVPFFLLLGVGYGFNQNQKYNPFPKLSNPSHLDKQNLEKLDKLLNVKNKSYSPFKRHVFIRINDTNGDSKNEVVDEEKIIQIMEGINKEIEKIFNDEMDKSEEDIKKMLENGEKMEDDEVDDDDKYRKLRKDAPKFTPQSLFAKPDDSQLTKSGNGGNFEIITNSPYTFKDIGGYDNIKEELMQIADILTNSTKYQKFNVRTPKGLILEGPPGNGKTLLAKCFAGEINVAFIPVSGSQFSEVFVGTGAARIRELFKLADENKPCIIFIDEIDALARKRGSDAVSSNSEKDQTLNQLLTNIDGFQESTGVFIMGATNRIDMLDDAMIRPGRIDKQIYLGNPDSKTREEILNIHLKGKPFTTELNVQSLVEMTGGFSCSQIENLLNEAMLKALRDNREEMTRNDLDFITNRILSGWTETKNKFSESIIERIVIHEMGHAIVGLFCKEHSKLMKVVLNLSSPKSPGFTLFENGEEDSYIYTKNGLYSRLMVLLSGRIAEEVFFGEYTTGAKQDFVEAYKLAESMVMHYGMGDQLIYPSNSDNSKMIIDNQINMLLMKANDDALNIIQNSKDIIKECADQLKRSNVLKPEHIIDVIDKHNNKLWEMYNTRQRYISTTSS